MILLTGGAGFVGGHVAEALLAAGQAVRVLDLRGPGESGLARETRQAIEWVVGDVRDADTVRGALAGVEAVSHQAGMVGLGTDVLEIVDYASHNDIGAAVLLGELARAGFGGRLVLASSMVVYGEGRYRCAFHGEIRPQPRGEEDLRGGRFAPRCPQCGGSLAPAAIEEDAPTDPRSVYAATKLHQEHLAFAFARETGLPVTALRYHNVYGPRMPRDTPYAGVASLWASALGRGEAPRVFEDGGQLRDFVHVRDVARANLLALTRPEPARGALNVCSGVPRAIGELAGALADAAGADAPRPVVTGEFRLGDVRHVFASAERAAHELGFRASVAFAEGVGEFAATVSGSALAAPALLAP